MSKLIVSIDRVKRWSETRRTSTTLANTILRSIEHTTKSIFSDQIIFFDSNLHFTPLQHRCTLRKNKMQLNLWDKPRERNEEKKIKSKRNTRPP